ncbi:MAG TPA: recombinase family protein, partial [Holophaga sp.]|nr:recombinase family protein [Holophaga sp.]
FPGSPPAVAQNILVSRHELLPDRKRATLEGMETRPAPLRAGVYARIRLEDALDLPKQGHALAAFAEQKGWQVALTELETVGETARRLPARERLLEAARENRLDVVVAWKLDRIARSLPELVSLLEGLRAAGVSVATLADDFDFTGERGAELMRILRTLASFERVTHRDQVRSGLAEAGRTVGRPASAQAHLQDALRFAAQGHSQREIARRLGIHPRTVGRLLAKARP